MNPCYQCIHAGNIHDIVPLCCRDVERGAVQTQSKERREEWSYESFRQPKKNKWGPSRINQENHPISIMVSFELQYYQQLHASR